MKKAIMMAALASFIAVPAMANDPEKKADWKIEKADTNGDGMISKAEHTAMSDKMFTDADTNKDGSLSKEELKAHMEKKKEEKKN